MLLAASSLAGADDAPRLIRHASVQDLIDGLRGEPGGTLDAFGRGPGFHRTELPDSVSNRCVSSAMAEHSRGHEPVPYMVGAGERSVNLDVKFAYGSDRILPSERSAIRNVAKALSSDELKGDRFALAGHTDISGDDRVNRELSCARALAVVRQLVSEGVDAQRITAYGFGSKRPLEGLPATDQQHRRVELRRER